MHMLDLPPEIVEQILLELDPVDIAFAAQTCSLLHTYIYDSPDQRLWRLLYLAEPLDDPSKCRSALGDHLPSAVDWRTRLQCIVRAQIAIKDGAKFSSEERCSVMKTLLDLACSLPSAPNSASAGQLSLNLVWLALRLGGGKFLEHSQPSDEEVQLRSHLHTCYGLTMADYDPAKRVESRAYVYAMRRYKWDNEFGPFMMDGSGRVNWEHMLKIHHVVSMQIVEPYEPTDAERWGMTLYPMSLPYCQSIIPEGLDLNQVDDWAGVAGIWRCTFCFVDHRELLVYNSFNLSDNHPLQVTIFEDPEFVEICRSRNVVMRVLSTEPDPDHPTRPKINFAGSIDNHATMVGWLKVTPDNQIRWHFKSGEQGRALWSSEGVQVGGVRSSFGVLGAWTTVHHDRHDPVGPFWLRKLPIEPALHTNES